MEHLLDLVARSLRYPDVAVAAAARDASRRLRDGDCPTAAAALADALAKLADHADAEPRKAEEHYTGLFDLSPVCTLHVGYHLFGESYERGALLAGLAGELEAAGLGRGGELPDDLPLLLQLFARLDPEGRALLFEHALEPGLERMAAALRSPASPWSAVIAALPAHLESLLSPAVPEAREVALHA